METKKIKGGEVIEIKVNRKKQKLNMNNNIKNNSKKGPTGFYLNRDKHNEN